MNQQSSLLFLVIFIWSMFWKGIALWRAATERQRNWFIAILLIDGLIFPALGILEILYLFKFAKKKLTIAEMKSWVDQIRSKK